MYVREMSVSAPYSGVACNSDSSLIAVGRRRFTSDKFTLIPSDAVAVLLDYISGAIVRTVGVFGLTILGEYCGGLRFTPAGDGILTISESTLSLFMLDGVQIKTADAFHGGDIDFTADDDIVAAGFYHLCLHAGGSIERKLLYDSRVGNNVFMRPIALAVAGCRLYVLDTHWQQTMSVRVFE